MQEYPTLTPEAVRRRVDVLIRDGYDVSPMELIKRSFDLCKGHFGPLIGFMLIILVLSSIPNMFKSDPEEFSLVATILSIFFTCITMVQYAGFFIYFHRLTTTGQATFQNLFDGFRDASNIIVVSLLAGVFILLGMILLVLPGIYLGVGSILAVPLVLFTPLTPWNAFQTSVKIIGRRWWEVFVLLLAILGLNILGALCLGVGILVTLPVSWGVFYLLFSDLLLLNADDDEMSEIGDLESETTLY